MRAIAVYLVLTVVVGSADLAARATPRQQSALTRAAELQEKAESLSGERKFDEAQAAAEESVALREAALGRDHQLVASSLNTLGEILFRRGDLTKAEAAFSRALEIATHNPKAPADDRASAASNLASALQAQGRLRDVEPLFAQALKLREGLRQQAVGVRAQDPDRYKDATDQLAGAHVNLGGLFTVRGDYGRAVDEFEKAQALWAEVLPADDPQLARAFNNLGVAYFYLDALGRAEDFYRRALAIREKAGESLELATTLNNLGSVLQKQARLDEAEPYYMQSIALYEKLTKNPEYGPLGQPVGNLAVIHLLRKDYAGAAPLYERSLAIREKTYGPDHPDVATALQAQAIYFYNTGQLQQAIETQARATGIVERNLALVLEVGSEPQKERYLQSFADSVDVTLWMRGAGAPNAAADRAALLTVLRRKGRIQEVMAASSDALRASLAGRPGAASADLDEYTRTRALQARLVLQAPGNSADRAKRLQDLEARADALEAKLSDQTAQTDRASAGVSIEAVQQKIPADGVLVDFFRYRPFDPNTPRAADRFGAPRYAAYALRSSGDPVWVEFGDAAAIDSRIDGLRAALLNPLRSDVTDRARGLLDPLTAPLLKLVGSSTHVYLVPDANLNLLPFHALVDANGAYLLETLRFTYLTSGRDLLTRPASASAGPPLIISNPAFGRPARQKTGMLARSFAPLPETAREADAVARLLPGARAWRGLDASETRLKAEHSPSILHLATHGFFLSDSPADAAAGTRGIHDSESPATWIPPLLRSGLALAGANTRSTTAADDGILTASEAALLDLHGTELVVLSACESGLGVVNAGESVYGMRRAFAIAGARSEVLTLWQVNDQATRALVVDFYQRLRNGSGRGDALQAAQRAALADPARRHPFYWAAFILSGADGPLPATPAR